MGIVQEIADLIGKLGFCSIVHEWEQGLYVRRGRVIEKRVKGGNPKKAEKQKILKPGVYFYIPILDEIIVRPVQEVVLNLENICVPSTDNNSEDVLVSCNIRYEIRDLYRAFTSVHDYEKSLKDYALAILAKHSRGKTYEQWKNPEMIENLEEEVKKEVKKIASDDWGLTISSIYITHNVKCKVVVYEGAVFSPNKLDLES